MSVLTVPTPIARHGGPVLGGASRQSGATSRTRTSLCMRSVRAAGDISLQQGESETASSRGAHANQSYPPSPINVGRLLLHALDRGFLTCHDARTGKEVYGRQRISAELDVAFRVTGDTTARSSRLSEDGDTFVQIEAGPEFRILGKNSL